MTSISLIDKFFVLLILLLVNFIGINKGYYIIDYVDPNSNKVYPISGKCEYKLNFGFYYNSSTDSNVYEGFEVELTSVPFTLQDPSSIKGESGILQYMSIIVPESTSGTLKIIGQFQGTNSSVFYNFPFNCQPPPSTLTLVYDSGTWLQAEDRSMFSRAIQLNLDAYIAKVGGLTTNSPYQCSYTQESLSLFIINCNLDMSAPVTLISPQIAIRLNEYLSEFHIPSFIKNNTVEPEFQINTYYDPTDLVYPTKSIYYFATVSSPINSYTCIYGSQYGFLRLRYVSGNLTRYTMLAVVKETTFMNTISIVNNGLSIFYTIHYEASNNYQGFLPTNSLVTYTQKIQNLQTYNVESGWTINSNEYTIITFKTNYSPFTQYVTVRGENASSSNSNELVLQYPYGFTNIVPSGGWEVKEIAILSNFGSTFIDSLTGPYNVGNSGNLDNKSPTIKKIEFIDLEDLTMLVRVNASDIGSGVFEIRFNDGEFIVEASDLISGTLNDGIFEKFVNYTLMEMKRKNSGYIVDASGNTATLDLDVPVPLFPKAPKIEKFLKENFELSSVSFKSNDIDLSNEGYKNQMFINFTNVNKGPLVKVNFDIDDSPDFYGKWNEDKQLFVVDFEFQARAFTNTIQYIITYQGFQYKSLTIEGLYGISDSGIIKASSTDADRLPPIILSITRSSNISDPVGGTLSWIITLTSSPNPLKNTTIYITTDLDPYNPYVFHTMPDSNNRINITIQVPPNCVTQIYDITYLEFYDKSNVRSIYDKYFQTISINENRYISPLIQILGNDFSITGDCLSPDSRNSTAHVSSLSSTINSLNIASNNRDISFKFKITDSLWNASSTHIPTCYLHALMFKKVSSKSKIVQSNGLVTSYECVFNQIPYGFGYPSAKIYLSIYGYASSKLIFTGFSTSDLINQGFSASIPITFEPQPYIESTTTFSILGGPLSFIGKNFGTNSNQVTVVLDFGQGIIKNFTTISFISNIYLTMNGLFPNSLPFKATIYVNGIASNTITIVPETIPIITSPHPQQCLGTPVCSGPNQGDCTENGCQCKNNWTGNDCSSQAIIIQPVINTTSPSIGTVIPGHDLKSLISIISLIELDKDNNQVIEHLLNDWSYQNTTSNQSTNQQKYTYTTKIQYENQTTEIITYITYFKEPETIQFGNELIEMLGSSIKYKLEITPYSFKSQLNHLQLIMSTLIESESSKCSYQENGKTITNENDYIKLQIDDKSLYGRFLTKGIIDGRIQKVTNTFIDQEDNEDSNQLFTQRKIGINIPNYQSTVQLDPDFSVLIDSNTAADKDNSICSNDKSGLTKSQLAGIIVGSVLGGCIILFILGYVIYRNSVFVRINIHKLKQLNKK